MSVPIIRQESTLTDKYQTTVPEPVRKALNLHKKEKICFTINDDGSVVLTRVQPEQTDPVLAPFLELLADDMKMHPEHIQPIDSTLADQLHHLVGDMDVDMDKPLNEENE